MEIAALEKRLDKVISEDMNDNTPGMALLITKGDDILIRKAYGLAGTKDGDTCREFADYVISKL